MRLILTCLLALTCLATLPAPAHSEFTQADRERMIQLLTRMEEIDKRFEQIDKRFEQIDKRFEELREDMNARFTTITNLMIAIISAFAAIVVMAIGFAYWDRRTMLRPLEEEVVKMKKTVADKVEVQLQEVTTKVASLEKQVAERTEAEAGKRQRIRDALAEMGSRGGEDARLAAIFRVLL